MDRYEYRPVPVEQLADYLNTSEGHEFTFHPPTLVRNAIRELYAIKKGQEPCAYLYGASFERGHVEGELTDAPGCDMPVYHLPFPFVFSWIEGDQPPKFGNYYVRYISDVGPQFCIARWMEYDPCVPSDRRVQAWIPEWSRGMNGLQRVTHYCHLPEGPKA